MSRFLEQEIRPDGRDVDTARGIIIADGLHLTHFSWIRTYRQC